MGRVDARLAPADYREPVMHRMAAEDQRRDEDNTPEKWQTDESEHRVTAAARRRGIARAMSRAIGDEGGGDRGESEQRCLRPRIAPRPNTFTASPESKMPTTNAAEPAPRTQPYSKRRPPASRFDQAR